MNVRIEESWREKLQSEFDAPYFAQLTDFVRHEYATTRVYPPGSQMFAAFDACPFDKVKVVILGQDPYHEPGQAHGLCFSVNDGVPFPPSLQNIFKEIHDDIGTPIPMSGDLSRWAHQGVLLLNATLTVRAHQAGSHQNKGWEQFTDAVIHRLAQDREHLVFILWGAYAQAQRRVYRPLPPLGVAVAPPVAPLGASGIFRKPPFQPRQRISRGSRHRTCFMVIAYGKN